MDPSMLQNLQSCLEGRWLFFWTCSQLFNIVHKCHQMPAGSMSFSRAKSHKCRKTARRVILQTSSNLCDCFVLVGVRGRCTHLHPKARGICRRSWSWAEYVHMGRRSKLCWLVAGVDAGSRRENEPCVADFSPGHVSRTVERVLNCVVKLIYVTRCAYPSKVHAKWPEHRRWLSQLQRGAHPSEIAYILRRTALARWGKGTTLWSTRVWEENRLCEGAHPLRFIALCATLVLHFGDTSSCLVGRGLFDRCVRCVSMCFVSPINPRICTRLHERTRVSFNAF